MDRDPLESQSLPIFELPVQSWRLNPSLKFQKQEPRNDIKMKLNEKKQFFKEAILRNSNADSFSVGMNRNDRDRENDERLRIN